MSSTSDLSILDHIGRLIWFVGQLYTNIFFSFGILLSLPSLLMALAVAYLWVRSGSRPRRRRIRLKVLYRAFFPRRLFTSPSTRADLGMFFLNTSIFTVIFGAAILSASAIAALVQGQLGALFGMPGAPMPSTWQMSLVMTLCLFVAYEASYYTDHYLCHRIPFLWEFHKVHHAAEILTPLSNTRVHPVDTLVFYNIAAVFMGATMGAVNYLCETSVTPFTLANSNIITLVFIYLFGHLQHSHFWIAFTGPWGRLILSPAHHQIHHSTNPVHFNRNLGHCLGIFDWMFGTLHVPSAKREKLSFGVDPQPAEPHGVTELLISPFGHALAHLAPAAYPATAQPDARADLTPAT